MLNRVFVAMSALAFGRAAGIHRTTSDSKRGRQMTSAKIGRSRSKYIPHIGAKEQERARRSYMQHFHGPMADYSPNLRSAAVVHQMSKRQYEAHFREVA